MRTAIGWAENLTYISAEDKEIIFTATKSLVYSEGQPWKKKDGDNLFDLTMGSYHGAEGCELVGLFILSQLNQINFEGGLYRDDGLVICKGTRRQNENTKKQLCEIFRRNKLKITVEVNLKVIDFLDVELDLERDLFSPL